MTPVGFTLLMMCAEAPALSGQSALPRHWTTPGELDGGTITVTVAGVPDAPPIAPTTPGQAITVTIPTEGSVGFVVNQAKDTDTYHWKLNGGSEDARLGSSGDTILNSFFTETVSWQDDCGVTTQPDQTRTVAYTQTQDESVKDENGAWQRAVKYQAFSSWPGGEEAPALSGQSALPRHWTTPGE